MMEKELNNQQLDELIRAWSEDKLPADVDNEITDSLMDFVDNDNTEIDVNELLDVHIHELALNESKTKRRKWRIFLTSAAAVAVVMLFAASIFISTREHEHHSDENVIVVESNRKETPMVIPNILPECAVDSSNLQSTGVTAKENPKIASNSDQKRPHEEEIMLQQEETSELILAESLAEINAGIVNMVDNTKECLSMTNVSLHPVSIFSDDEETNRIETTLINTLYEIRTLNLDLNFETDNKKTEI